MGLPVTTDRSGRCQRSTFSARFPKRLKIVHRGERFGTARTHCGSALWKSGRLEASPDFAVGLNRSRMRAEQLRNLSQTRAFNRRK